jgi:hypothetical protein
MQFTEVEVRSLSAENRSMGFVEMPDTMPAAIRQVCLEYRSLLIAAKQQAPQTRRVKPEPAASEAEKLAISRHALQARIRNLN